MSSSDSPDGLWGVSGPIPPAQTLILANGLGTRAPVPDERDIAAALRFADGVHFQVATLAGGPALVRPTVKGRHDLRLGERRIAEIGAPDLGAVGLDPVLCRLRGRPINVELMDVGGVDDLPTALRMAGIDEADVVVSAVDPLVPPRLCLGAGRGPAVPIRAGLILDPEHPVGSRSRQIFPAALMRRTWSDCVSVPWVLYRTGVLLRSAGRPGIVWTINEPRRLRQCFKDRRVRAVITDTPELALQIRRDLG
jgi:hypothetical protein